MERLARILAGPVLAGVIALAGFGFLGLAQLARAVGEPPAGTVQSVQTYTLYDASITQDGTVYSTGQRFQFYNAGDVFITVADLQASGTVTITAQASPDDSNYANLDYEYADADALLTQPYRRVMTADGTEIMRLPMVGEYLRVSIWTSSTVTMTVQATMRNN